MIFSWLSSTDLWSEFNFSYYIDKLVVIITPETLISPQSPLWFWQVCLVNFACTFVAIFFVCEAIKLVYPSFCQNFLVGKYVKSSYLNMLNAFLGGSKSKL